MKRIVLANADEHATNESGLTEIDARIRRQVMGASTDANYADGDNVDACAMMAVHVHAERRHRINGLPPESPALRVRVYRDTKLRESVEAENGEPLR